MDAVTPMFIFVLVRYWPSTGVSENLAVRARVLLKVLSPMVLSDVLLDSIST